MREPVPKATPLQPVFTNQTLEPCPLIRSASRTLARSHNDTSAIRYVHDVIATDASFAICYLLSVASTSASKRFG
jgi:hypothetical protein